MDVVAIVNELRRELQQIDSLILALDSLHHGRRRGRPPKLLQRSRPAGQRGMLSAPGPKKGRTITRKASKRVSLSKKGPRR